MLILLLLLLQSAPAPPAISNVTLTWNEPGRSVLITWSQSQDDWLTLYIKRGDTRIALLSEGYTAGNHQLIWSWQGEYPDRPFLPGDRIEIVGRTGTAESGVLGWPFGQFLPQVEH